MRPEVREARLIGRGLITVAVVLPFLVLIAWVMQPGGISPMYEPPWYAAALPWAGVAGYLLGLGWMIRIYRANPERGERSWRYRS